MVAQIKSLQEWLYNSLFPTLLAAAAPLTVAVTITLQPIIRPKICDYNQS